MSKYIEQAERNDDGDLIFEKTVPTPGGGTTTVDVNVTTMYQPGPRRTSSVEMLRVEAELVDEGKELDNPAKPSNGDVAKQAIEQIEGEGLTPAWRVVDDGVSFP
ncbi:hypothetical protein M196_gp08 [Halorubrum tailed virus 4]|uniref:Uncharacterized protein n=1 Tax=Halorubrum tailed virus 4 TaxID=1273752 RepID=R4TLS1_9CAUD|nr:hypothetical protein M196_gp08 [Halorubrum tailed virus 4]AGM11103.1 hypothetical protein HRTV4_8 [Halorubrum tailed virus 4]